MSSRLFKQGGTLALITMGAVFVGSMAYGVKEEVPVGTLGGTVVMTENGRALPGAEVVFTPGFKMPEDAPIPKATKTDAEGRFAVGGMPAGMYYVSVYGKVHNVYEDTIYVPEGGAADKKLSAEPTGSRLELKISDRVFLPDEDFKATISGTSEANQVAVDFFRVDPQRLERGDSLYNYANSLIRQKSATNPAPAQGEEPIRSINHDLKSRDVEGYFTETLAMDAMPEGIYLVRAKSKDDERFAWFTVSRIGLVTKTIDRKGLAYVVDLKTGKPVKGAQIAVHSPTVNSSVGQSDMNGMVSFTVPNGDNSEVSASATYGGSKAFTWFYSYRASGDNAQIWMQTDRPVYRPGDQVQFRGVIRTAVEGALNTPTTGEVRVKVYDPDEIVISDQTLNLSKFGTFSGDFASDAIAPPGGYRIEVEYGQSTDSRTVQILAYRKPEFSISVTTEKRAYRRGEPIRWKVKVEYFTGEPVAGAAIDSSAYRGAKWWGSPFDEEYEDSEYGSTSYYDEYLGQFQATTNASGEATIVTPSGTFESEYADYSDYEYSLDVSVSDQSGRGFTGSGRVAVTRGSFDLTAEFESWIADPGQSQVATVQATDYETQKGRAGLKVSYDYVRTRWTRNDMVEVSAAKGTVTTDADGKAKIEVTPDMEGSYTLKVWVQEERTKVASESWQWVGGGGDSGPAPDLQVVMDKAKYTGKDIAKALIRTAAPGGYALVSIESDALKRVQVIELKDTATKVSLGNLGEFAPGAEVSVAYIKDKQFMSAGATLRVDYTMQKLSIDVAPDRPEAKPGESVTYTIRATDDKGRPVSAELAMGVVDEGIYQILEDTNDPLKEFYSYDWNRVDTRYSFPELYLDSEDKASPNVQIRKVFKDTAYWSPSVVTDAQGRAKVTVKMPDNLTSWRATVTAVTADSRFGKNRASVIVKKDLMARLSPPSFMVQGDTQEVSGLVTNTTDQPQVVDAKLIGVGLQIEGEASRRITVPARGAETVTWNLLAGDPTSAKLEFTAVAASGLNDGLQQSFPVKPFGRRTVSGVSGAKTGGETFALEVDAAAVAASLDLTVEPSLASTIVTSIEQLVQYPYGCTEQTMSRFMPAVAAQGLLVRLGAMPDSVRDKLPQVTKESLRRLRRFQSSEGGWGWWEYDEPDMRMTAVVLEGLYEARQAGVNVDPTMIDRGLKWARESLAKVPDSLVAVTSTEEWNRRWEIEKISQLAYATSLYGPDPAVTRVNRLFMTKAVMAEMSPAELARLSLAWKRIAESSSGANLTEAEAYGRQAYEALLAQNKTDDLYDDSWWGEDNPRAMQAMAEYESDPDRVAAFAMRMLPRRQNGEWSSTRQAAIYVLAVKRYLEKAGVTTLDGEISVLVNGVRVGGGVYNASNQSRLSVKLTMDQLKKGSNEIVVRSTAGSAPVYLARLDQVVGMAEIPQADAPTLRIQREYVRMEAQQMEDGTMRLVPKGGAVNKPKSGEVLRCRVTIKADEAYQYVMVEDPIPSGFRIVEADEPFSSYGEWSWWWDATSFYDDRAVFFKAKLPKGESIFEYAVRAEAPGRSRALPTFVSPMYQPEIMASSSSVAVEVVR